MNQEEFAGIRKELARLFPSLLKWFENLEPEVQQGQRRAWFNAWKDLSEEEIYGAMDQITSGKAEPFGRFQEDRERIGLHLRNIVLETRRKLAREKPAQTQDNIAGLRDFQELEGITESFQQIQNRVAMGVSVEEATREIFGPIDENQEPRYKCLLCKDLGWVYVWRREAIRAVLAGVIDTQPEHRTVAVLPCSCEAGNGKHGIEHYRIEAWCPCKDGRVNDPQNLKDLKSWVQAQLDYAEKTRSDRRDQQGMFDE